MIVARKFHGYTNAEQWSLQADFVFRFRGSRKKIILPFRFPFGLPKQELSNIFRFPSKQKVEILILFPTWKRNHGQKCRRGRKFLHSSSRNEVHSILWPFLLKCGKCCRKRKVANWFFSISRKRRTNQHKYALDTALCWRSALETHSVSQQKCALDTTLSDKWVLLCPRTLFSPFCPASLASSTGDAHLARMPAHS